MRYLSALLLAAFHVALWSECATSDKELIMLEIEPIARDDRIKRSSSDAADAGERFVRQAHAIPPEYLTLLQQLAPQRAAAAQQQPPIEQLLVARDGNKQPATARYILNPDGRIVQERLTNDAIKQNEYHQEQYIQVPQAPQPTGQTGFVQLTPELEAFSQLQTQSQQDYHDAPIRAQIAGLTERPNLVPGNPVSAGGPGSASPQVYPQAANQAIARQEARLREQLENPVYGQYQIDPAYYPQFVQQQQAQQASVASADTGRQLTPIYDLSQRQKVVYQAAQAQLQPQPQSQPQAQLPYTPKLPSAPTRQPIGASAQVQLAPSTQPQLLQDPNAAQQYLVETSRPGSQTVRYVPQPQEDIYASLYSAAGRGLFSPAVAPTKSALYRPRASPKSVVNHDQIPTVRIPAAPNQRALSRSELDALVNAGYSITPVGNEEPEAATFLKSKRAPLPLTRRNHVIYQNQQDGVSYQYSPGSSDYNPTKAKRYAPNANNLYRAENGRQGVLTYVVALQNQAA